MFRYFRQSFFFKVGNARLEEEVTHALAYKLAHTYKKYHREKLCMSSEFMSFSLVVLLPY